MISVLVFLKKVDEVNKTCMLILIVFSKDNTVMFSRIWVCIWKREKILQLKILLRSFWLKCKSVKKRQKLFVCIETNCDSVQKVPNRVNMQVNEVQVQTGKRPSRKKCKINKIQYTYVYESTSVLHALAVGFRRWYMYQTRKKKLRIMDWSPYLHILKPFESCLYKSW